MGIGAASRDAIDPVLEITKQQAWARRALRVLPIGAAAEAAARGIDRGVDLADEAADQGVPAGRFGVLTDLARSYPGLPDLLTLWRRGSIDGPTARAALRRLGYSDDWADRLLRLRTVLPTVTDMVRFAVREVYNPAQRDVLDLDAEFPPAFAEQATRIGLDRDTAGDYWAAHWELPSYSQGAEMLFRGEIDQAQFNSLLKALDYAPTWRRPLQAIARRIPTLTDMIRFAYREVYSPEQRDALGLDADYPEAFTAEAALHGMSEDRARQYWAAHWRLPSATQGYTMLHRGVLELPELRGLLKALDYPKLWRDRLVEIAHLVPGRIDLRRMLSAGLIDAEQAQAGYLRLGYAEHDARLLVQLAQAPAGASAKELTAAQLADEYEGHYIAESGYREQLADLGYAPADVDRLVRLSDARRVRRAREATIGRIRTSYVGHKLNRADTVAALLRAQVPQPALELLMLEWDNAKDANVSTLTQAQIVKAYKNSRMTREAAIEGLMDRGFSEVDAGQRIDLETKPDG